MTPLDECKATYQRWLHLPDPGALLVMLATIVANRVEGDPVWTVFVAPPGAGKTELLNGLTGLPDVHPAATITEPALLSGTPRKEKAEGAKGGLLREIGEFGIIVLKDFGSILSMHREARAAILAGLREIYDGSWTRHVGVDGGRTLHWEGKVGLIAGCTPTIDGHHAVMAAMGERFVLYRLPAVDGTAQAKRALSHVGKERLMRQELAKATSRVLDEVDFGNCQPRESDDDRLVSIAELAVRCRSAVERDSYNREILLIPGAEAPGRLALVLRRLLDALRALGVDEATAWAEVRKCGLDSIPAIRRSVLEALLPVATSTTAELATQLGYPTTTTRRSLEDLAAHGLVTRQKGAKVEAKDKDGRADIWELDAWTRDRLIVPEMSEEEASATVPGMSAEHSEGDLFIPSQKVQDDFSGKMGSNGHRCTCGAPLMAGRSDRCLREHAQPHVQQGAAI